MTQQYLYAYIDAPLTKRDSIIKPDYERAATIGDMDTRERTSEPKEDAIVLYFI
jgi:hypothetical protein